MTLRKETLYPVYDACGFIYSVVGNYDGCLVEDFISPEKLLRPNKCCVLHELIIEVLSFYRNDMFYDFADLEINGYRDLVATAGLAFPADAEKRILDGMESDEDKGAVWEVISKAMEKIEVPSIFHTLYSDRNFIATFQYDLQKCVRERGHSVLGAQLTKNGTIPRVHLPKWLAKAVFFRDQGKCQLCDKDISGLRSPFDEVHLDHIVPLADFGNNDPTNFQLVCRECNLAKGAKTHLDQARFVPYW
jgi:hypothetical protein